MIPTAPVLRAASRIGARRSAMTAAASASAPAPIVLRDHIYFARASAHGPGRNGTVSVGGMGSDKTADDALEITMAIPRSMGGKGKGQTPERLFAMSYSSSFLDALQAAAAEAGCPDVGARARVHTSVFLGRPDGRATSIADGLGLSVEVDVEGVEDDRIIRAAHDSCAYSRMMALGGQVAVKKL